MYNSVVFIYAKDGKIKVLEWDDATRQENKLKSEGWVHTSTRNAAAFLEYLYNECKGQKIIYKEIGMLGGVTK